MVSGKKEATNSPAYCLHLNQLVLVVQMVDGTIHWINHYSLDNSIGFERTYLVDKDLSRGWIACTIQALNNWVQDYELKHGFWKANNLPVKDRMVCSNS